jgi:hypothetical protein
MEQGSTHTPKVFFFVIAGFETHHYREQIKYRKLQFKKYNIPHCFIFDTDPPETYTPNENDLFLEKLEPIPELHEKTENNHLNPFIVQKFIRAIKRIDFSAYDYIVRTNISTFVNIPLLLRQIQSFPKHKIAAAHRFRLDLEVFNYNNKNNPFTLFSGTCIVMSKDIVEELKKLHDHSTTFYVHNDDVTLTYHIDRLARIKLNLPLWWCDANDIPCPEDVMSSYPVIRIKHYTNPEVDIRQWKRCLKYVDSIDVDAEAKP